MLTGFGLGLGGVTRRQGVGGGYMGDPPSTFRGNPNVTISSIAGTIAASRTSGYAPMIVQFSAMNITAVGTSKPYEDLWFDWHFGDANGTETFSNPGTRGGTVNGNVDQCTPEAAYAFRTPGTYVVTLMARGKTAGSPILYRTTITITVADFATASGYARRYVDSAAAGGGDGSIGAPWNSLSDVNTFIASGTNKHVSFKRGSSWSSSPGTGNGLLMIGGASTANGTVDGLVLDAYGSGAAPSFTNSAGVGCVLLSGNGTGATAAPKTNIYIGHLDFISNSDSHSAVVNISCVHTSANCLNWYFDDCGISATVSTAVASNVSVFQAGGSAPKSVLTKFGHYNCRFDTPAAPTQEMLPNYVAGKEWYLQLGGYVHGGTFHAGGIDDHYNYINTRDNICIEWVDCSGADAGSERGYCFNINSDVSSGALQRGGHIAISECNMQDGALVHDASNSNNNPAYWLYSNVVCQLNRVHNLIGTNALVFYNAETYTHRYNEVWGVDGGRYFFPAPGGVLNDILQVSFYGNKIYRTASQPVLDMDIMNLAQSITDEAYQRANTTAAHYDLDFSIAHNVDRNTWWCTSATASTNQFLNLGATRSFTQAQAAGFDLHSVVANPNWPDPANGDFGAVSW